MNLTKRITAWFLTLVMVLGLIPQTMFAQEIATSPLQYEATQEMNEDKTEATISIKFTETETIQLEKVTLSDGTEKVEDLSEVTYTVSENGKYDFKVNYVMEGTPQEETISVEVSGLEEKIKELVTNQNIELDVDIQLKGATYFDGHPNPFFGGTKQYMISDRSIIPYNGMQLMELIVEIPYQEGLEIQGITPSAASQYPDLSKVEKDDKNKKWTYSFYFYKNGTYEFTIDYILNGENKITSTSFTVDGLVSIKDIAMRRHLINEYGEFSGFRYQDGQYVTQDILAKEPSVGFFTFGLDGDNGTTAEYTTSLDGLQYLKNATGLYLYDCKKLAEGETIEPVTEGYYPNMKLFRVSNLNERPNMPKSAYNAELVTKSIANMPALTELVINGTGFSDCTVFRKITAGSLDYLQAMANNIVSLDGIESQQNLSSINIGQNKIKSIDPLSKLNQINFLNLMRNEVFDLRPINESLNQKAVAGNTVYGFAAREQNITYDRTVITPLQNGMYTVELPMPIDIDGSLTNTSSVSLKFANGTTKTYSTSQSEGKTYISIPEGDVDSSQENPFEGAEFKFSFNNNNGADPRTKAWFTGTVTFKASPIATNYHVIYDFISGTRGKSLPPEITDLLPIDSTKYYEGDTITAKNPTQLELEVSDGVWTFEGYDADSKTANANSANEDGNIQFTGTWIFETKKYDVSYKFESINTDKEVPKEILDMLPTVGSVEHGKTVNAPETEYKDVKVTDGVWSFKGWTPAKYENVTGNVEFVGKWEFTKNTYSVIYEFVSGTKNKELPKEVINLLPSDDTKYEHGSDVTAITPDKTTVVVADGTWTFKGYDKDKAENISSAVKFIGTWEFTVNQYVVDYKFESTNTDKELPKEIIDQLPTAGSVEHGKTVNAPETEYKDVKVTDGVWSFKGWTPAKYENVTGNVEFVGKWEFTKNTYSVIYEFVSGTKNKELPKEVINLLPSDDTKYEHGSDVTAITPDKTTVVVADGTWTFKGYDKDKAENISSAVKFIGTWEFTVNQYVVDYKFESTNTDKELPKEIIDQLPTAGSVEHGKTVNAPETEYKDVKVTDGVWSFKGWTPAKYENVTGNVEFVGKWEFTKNTYSVIYEFVSGTKNKELPKEVINLLPSDDTKYEHGSDVTAITPDKTTVVVADGTWTFKGYDKDKAENISSAVKFIGTWEFTVNQYVVDYKFESTNTDKELPKEIIDQLPTAGSVEHGKTVNAPETEYKDVKVTDGVWSFKGWTPVKYENVTGNVEFVGKWEFKKNASIINHIPTISASDKTLTVGDTFDPLKDVTARDKEDGDLTKEIEILKNEVNTSKARVYEVTYKVTDSKGASSIKTIYVTVNPKMEELNRIPTISASDKTLTVGDTFDPLKDVTATDKEDGDLTKEIEILKNEVNTSEAGVYEVTYKVTDSKGASSIKTIYVTVNPKMEELNRIPTISASDKTLTVGDTFDSLKDVTATDKEDGDLTKEIEILKNEVNTSKAGVYEVTYKVTDSKGASSIKTIKVTVIEKNIPIIPNEPDKPSKPDTNKPEDNGSVGTGDKTNGVFWTMLSIICGISVIGVYRKKREINQ